MAGKTRDRHGIGLYIHYPWCLSKCPYCDFSSRPRRADPGISDTAYLGALLQEVRMLCARLGGRSLTSVFFGGGTPSLLPPQAVGRLLTAAAKYMTADCEVTLEANPGTVSPGKLADLRAAGVTRLSLGVQSFQDRALKAIGRAHDAAQAREAVWAVQKAGFDSFNLDLMHGLPGQSVADMLEDLRRACATNAEHLSWYELTLEDDTPFGRRPPRDLPAEQSLEEAAVCGLELLRAGGFAHYEVSAYTRGRPCRHNLTYWRFGDYLGAGAGAHSKLTTDQGIFRRAGAESPGEYLERPAEFVRVDPAEIPFEFMLNRLRLRAPVSFREFVCATALSADCLTPALRRARELGLMRVTERGFALTADGRRYLNQVLELFLPA